MRKSIFILLVLGLPLFIALPGWADRGDGGDDNGDSEGNAGSNCKP